MIGLPRSRPAPARLAALAVAVAGVLLLLLGVAQATVWGTPSRSVVHVAGRAGVPIVVTTPEALAIDGPSVQVTVRAANPSQQVFAGVGRASDVEAYLGTAARTEVTGIRGSQAVTASAGSDPSLPEPSGVDVWAKAATGRGTVTLDWPRADGHWRAVAAVDGATPPAEVVITWQRGGGSVLVPTLLALGALLLVLGLVGVRATRRRPASGRRTAPRAARSTAPLRTSVPASAGGADGADSAEGEDGEDPEDDAVDEAPAPFRQERRS